MHGDLRQPRQRAQRDLLDARLRRAVSATESPSQLSPALIHRTWTRVSSAAIASADGIGRLPVGACGLKPRTS